MLSISSEKKNLYFEFILYKVPYHLNFIFIIYNLNNKIDQFQMKKDPNIP